MLPRHIAKEGGQKHWFGVNINVKLVILCFIWYTTSVISSSSTKNILIEFKHPVSLTEIQFVMNAVFCLSTIYLFNHLELAGRSIINKFPPGTFPTDLGQNHYSIYESFLKPSKLIFKTTVPMGMFQFLGQIASHNATSIIPVSLVHTIKALSPMTTVLIYKVVFNKVFSYKTYITLVPLIVGVMLSCSKNTSKHVEDSVFHTGCLFAFASMLIFVSQNIFAKRILTWDDNDKVKVEDDEELRANEFLRKFNWRITRTESAISTPILPVSKPQLASNHDGARPSFYLGNSESVSSFNSPINTAPNSRNPSQLELNKIPSEINNNQFGYISPQRKLDKLTVLFYCSIVGFVLTFPIYLVSEVKYFQLFNTLSVLTMKSQTIQWVLIYSISHFIQSLVAFQILGMVSPINYSIANILKRIIIIAFSIIIEGNHTQLSRKQWVGLILTFIGLYSYDKWGTEKRRK